MVCIRKEYCDGCEKNTQHYDGRCQICAEKGRKAELALWNSKSVNERLTELRQRVEDLELTCERKPFRC